VTAHPAVSAVGSETHLFSHGIQPLADRFHHAALGSGQVGSTFIERDALLDALRDFCDAVFAPMIESGKSRLAERTPLHALHTRLIHDVYPDARIVHIIRDGRDVVRSLLAQQWGPESVAEGAREWRASIETARAGAGDSERYLEVRYEDLHADPRQRIAGLYRWLGLPVDDAILERALAEAKTHPYRAKRALARRIAALYHGVAAAEKAEAHFDLLFRAHATPEDVPELQLRLGDERLRYHERGGAWLPGLLVATRLASSNAEAVRLIEQGAIAVDERRIGDRNAALPAAAGASVLLRRGKRQFARVHFTD
jgi:hypothetical protein